MARCRSRRRSMRKGRGAGSRSKRSRLAMRAASSLGSRRRTVRGPPHHLLSGRSTTLRFHRVGAGGPKAGGRCRPGSRLASGCARARAHGGALDLQAISSALLGLILPPRTRHLHCECSVALDRSHRAIRSLSPLGSAMPAVGLCGPGPFVGLIPGRPRGTAPGLRRAWRSWHRRDRPARPRRRWWPPSAPSRVRLARAPRRPRRCAST